MSAQETLLKFPCSFPLKVVGKNSKDFIENVHAIVCRHFLDQKDIEFSARPSSGDKYLSITATFIAQSQEEIDKLYTELNELEQVVITM